MQSEITEKHEKKNPEDSSRTALIVGVLIIAAYAVVASLIFEASIIVMFFEVMSGAAVVGMAVLMYPILKPHNRNISLGYLIIKDVEGVVMIFVGILFFSERISEETRGWFYDDIHVYFFGIAYLILCYLMYQSILVPRFISVWGFIGSILFLTANLLVVMGLFSAPPPIALLPVVLNELFLAIWFIVKGFNLDAIISD
jgi:hypothetical protein